MSKTNRPGTGVAGKAPATPPTGKLVKAAFVLIGPAQDGGWSLESAED